MVIGNWLKYSKWEESQGEIQRTRSVYERALDIDHRNVTLWLRYAEMEMRNRQVSFLIYFTCYIHYRITNDNYFVK